MEDPWRTLGIAPTTSLRLVKKAYAARLKRVHPEDDAEGFQALRQAYELACGFNRSLWSTLQAIREGHDPARNGRTPPVPPPPPVASAPAAAGGNGALAAESSFQAAHHLVMEVERLHEDEDAWGSEEAWKALLARDLLWNIDARSIIGQQLLAFLARPETRPSAMAWYLLDQEFRWSESTQSLVRHLPPERLDWVLDRIERARLEYADSLWRDRCYGKAIRVLGPLVSANNGWDELMMEARQLLHLCIEGAASQMMIQVHILRGDVDAWASGSAWRALLQDESLRQQGTRNGFEWKLLELLGQNESARRDLSADVWLLLEAEYDWSRRLPSSLLRGFDEPVLNYIGRAVVQKIERLYCDGRYGEAIETWTRFNPRLGPDLQARARLVLDRCSFAILQVAERLHDRHRYQEAIDVIEPTVPKLSEGPATRARFLLERCHRMHCLVG